MGHRVKCRVFGGYSWSERIVCGISTCVLVLVWVFNVLFVLCLVRSNPSWASLVAACSGSSLPLRVCRESVLRCMSGLVSGALGVSLVAICKCRACRRSGDVVLSACRQGRYIQYRISD